MMYYLRCTYLHSYKPTLPVVDSGIMHQGLHWWGTRMAGRRGDRLFKCENKVLFRKLKSISRT